MVDTPWVLRGLHLHHSVKLPSPGIYVSENSFTGSDREYSFHSVKLPSPNTYVSENNFTGSDHVYQAPPAFVGQNEGKTVNHTFF